MSPDVLDSRNSLGSDVDRRSPLHDLCTPRKSQIVVTYAAGIVVFSVPEWNVSVEERDVNSAWDSFLAEVKDRADIAWESVEVVFGGEEERKNEADTPEKKPGFGTAQGLIEVRDNFDEPLEDFQDYM